MYAGFPFSSRQKIFRLFPKLFQDLPSYFKFLVGNPEDCLKTMFSEMKVSVKVWFCRNFTADFK